MTTQDTIRNLLDNLKPEGTRWIVYVNDDGFKCAYGPFDLFGEAQKFASANGEVIPLYPR